MFKTKPALTEATAPPEPAPPSTFRAPLDKASILERCRHLPDGAAVAKKLIDTAEASFEAALPPVDYKAMVVRDAVTAVRRFLAENGETKFIRDDRPTMIDGAAAGFRFSVDGETCWLILPEAWPAIVGGRRSDFEAALIDAGALFITENVSYFPTPKGVLTHTSRSPVSARMILGLERRGFVISQAGLDQIPVEPTNPEDEARRAIGQVCYFLSRHASRFRPLDADAAGTPPTPDLAGWRSGSGDAAEWWVLPSVWKWEVCVGIDPVKVARMINDAGHLARGTDALQAVRKVANAPHRAYCIKPSIFAGVGNAV